ncbi:histidine kinase [Rhodocytophaga rosea]|uniref:Histidine kinase n=1 Tax=Rhodocytophaga rosea TaxID=2704465 RepID=A0A6C0GF36_9BACT|nr:histidine kinase [Rhodocytophaga rosea]QHT66280.1 histidine kinase [Rhodocytophaga rosea]
MKVPFDKGLIRFYARAGAAFLSLWLFGDLVSETETFLPRAINNIWRCLYVILANFILLEYTLPFIRFTWKRILAGIFLIWMHLMFYSFGLYAWRLIGIGLHIYTPLTTFSDVSEGVQDQMSFSIASILFFGITRHMYNYTKLKQAAQQLRIEKQAAELNYLKSQTNPHFLFNTLNNIYSLARIKSDLAPESILRLSQLLRFMLYETSGAYIAIEQELKIISDYIALEKLRYDESLHINFSYNIEDMKQAIPPLLLIPLVENAFKHGVSETRDRPFVDIHLSVNKRQLAFTVKNSTDTFPDKRPVKENIGLSNLRRQLELLYTNYSLTVQQGDSIFTATLQINLASHV